MLLVVTFVAMGAGIHEKMIEDSVRLSSGHVTITGEGYLENRTLEHFVAFDPELARLVEEGKVRVVLNPESPLPFTDAGVNRALELQETRHAKGKLVVQIADEQAQA